jgi:hypothetical protein
MGLLPSSCPYDITPGEVDYTTGLKKTLIIYQDVKRGATLAKRRRNPSQRFTT